MGKARILSAQGEGLYSIEILEDRTRAESRRTINQQRITEIDSDLANLEQQLDTAQQAVDAAAQAQDAAIDDYQALLDSGTATEAQLAEARQAMTEAAEAIIEAAKARDAVRLQIAQLNLERLSRQTAIDLVDALPDLRQQDAWCADYTEDLSGEVATAEVPGEIGRVIIKPGFEGANQWSASEDGAIQPALAGTPAGVFYNLAMMPGWQRWRPTFRIATISNINEDLCDITLDAATSSQQGLNVNAQGSYSGVPIYYMDCNGGAFDDGDRVLVAFSGNTDQPMVVGFEKEPRECRRGNIILFFGGIDWDKQHQIVDALIAWLDNSEQSFRRVNLWVKIYGRVTGGNAVFFLSSSRFKGVTKETLLKAKDFIYYAKSSLDDREYQDEVSTILWHSPFLFDTATVYGDVSSYVSSYEPDDTVVSVVNFGWDETHTKQSEHESLVSDFGFSSILTAAGYDTPDDQEPPFSNDVLIPVSDIIPDFYALGNSSSAAIVDAVESALQNIGALPSP